MRRLNRLVPVTLFLTAVGLQACNIFGEPPVDDSRSERRLFQIKGVMRGSVFYHGPRPCSQNGHIVGTAVILVFDRRNPPPPAGLANTAINFGAVTGDALFANEPRNPGPTLYCPKDHGFTEEIDASVPFIIAPMDAGSYLLQSFYDYYGDFRPTFKIRNLPLAGDIGGGYFDTVDAAKNRGDINYQAKYLPVDIGVPLPLPAGAPSDAVPTFVIPNEGFVVDNIPVNVVVPFALPRPYFYAANLGSSVPGDFADGSDKPGTSDGKETGTPKPHPGSKETDPDYMPVVTMTQDWQVEAQPTLLIEDNVKEQQDSFVSVQLKAGVAAPELPKAIDPLLPFHFQISKPPSLFIWANGTAHIPETNKVGALWPLVVFAKLQDEPAPATGTRATNPQGLLAQGVALGGVDPIVIIQGLTLFNDSLFATAGLTSPVPKDPSNPDAKADHATVLVRPSVICFDPNAIDAGGILVTPRKQGKEAGSGTPGKTVDIIDVPLVRANIGKQVREIRFACLPKGRYGINVVYSTGQAWTVPNEAGSCGGSEGTSDFANLTCTKKPRDVLYSQGNRAVLEIVDAKEPGFCAKNRVPVECCPSAPPPAIIPPDFKRGPGLVGPDGNCCPYGSTGLASDGSCITP